MPSVVAFPRSRPRPSAAQLAGAAGRAAGRASSALAFVLPALLILYLSFNRGGLFPGAPGVAAGVLAVILAVRGGLVRHPAAGIGPAAAAVAAALAGFALWTLISSAWSGSASRAMAEYDRALLYALAFALFASMPIGPRRLAGILGSVAAAGVGVCVVALAVRFFPDVWHVASHGRNDRLNYPLGYWNAMGLLAALTALACLHFAASEREPRVARVLASLALPAVSVAALLTFSRGALGAAALGVGLYLLVARPRALPSALAALVVPLAVALHAAYDADALQVPDPTGAAATGAGHGLAGTVLACCIVAAALRAALLPLDSRLAAIRISVPVRRALATAGVVVLLSGAAVAGAAVGAPHQVSRAVASFKEKPGPAPTGPARDRLFNAHNNGRIRQWRVAADSFEQAKLTGRGAGTFDATWDLYRPTPYEVFDAPSVYLEILSELGAVGLLLLAVALVGIAGGAARRARGRERAVYAAVIAIVAAWALGAGLDWDWEMPAVTIPVFVLGGAALARSGELVRAWRPHPLLRVGLVAVLLLLVVTPARVAVSQAHLDRAVDALADGNCSQAVPAATQAHRAAPDRAEPLQVEALCAIRDGQGEKAATLIQQALDRDPWSWRLRLDLALARAVSGEDPRPAWFLARQLNPQGLEIKRMGEIFGSTPRRRWPEVARTVQMPFPRSD